jgi:hypothetical protein
MASTAMLLCPCHASRGSAPRRYLTSASPRHERLCAGPAELWHGTGRGQPPIRIHDLEAIRDELGQ